MKKLSSLLLTLYALGAVVFFLIIGMVLAQVEPFSLAMPAMDQGLIRDWLPTALGGKMVPALLGLWFLALCASVGILVLNLCACTITRLLPRLKNNHGVHTWLLLLAHVLMVVILVGHLSQMTLGFKKEGLKLLPGQTAELPGGQKVRVDKVVYVDDLALLNLTYRQGRRAQTAERFHRERNLVSLSLHQGGQAREKGELRILEPLLAGGLRITLSDLYREGEGDKARVGAVLTIIRNPFTQFFFTAYLGWIVVYMALAVQGFTRSNNHLKTNGATS